MPGQSKVNGVWKTATGLSVKVSGSWKTATGAFIKVGGQWKQWFASKIQDAFNRSSTSSGLGIADSGQAWNATRGNWRISGAQTAISDDNAGDYALSSINLGASDVNINVDSSGGVGPAFWVSDAGSWWGSYVRNTTSTTSVCNQGYSTCGGSGCNPGNCCSGINQSTDYVCNGGPVATCSGSNCNPGGCCSGVSYSGGGLYCSDYRTGQSSCSGAAGDCTCTQSGGGTECSGYGTYSSNVCDPTCPSSSSTTYACNVAANSLGSYPSNCCGNYSTQDEQYIESYSCAYNISECVGYNCTPSGCCSGEGWILRNYYANGKYYTDCYSGQSANWATRTRYYCSTPSSTPTTTWTCYTGRTNVPITTSCNGCWGYSAYPITGSCYTSYNAYTTRGCYTSTSAVPLYNTDLVIISSVSGSVVTESTVSISSNTSGFTQVGSMFVSTLGNAITSKAYSGTAQTGEIATATATPANPVKGTSVGILKAPSTGSQGSTADSFLATLNI